MTVIETRARLDRRVRDRRIERSRRTLEVWLYNFYRPRGWAAAVSNHLGLQGHVRVAETTIRRADAAPLARPLRIGFASDFHAGPTTHPRVLEEACAALAALRPDVLLFGGDFVSVRASDFDQLAPYLASLEAPLGKFGVLGNHDLHANAGLLMSKLERAGVRLIVNERVSLAAPFDSITVCGLDDPMRGHPRPELSLDGAVGTRIVLMHAPETIAAIGDRPFELALCGHTHGGQLALPSGAPIIVPGGPLNRTYCRGQFDLEGAGHRTLLVTRGVGTSTLPARLFSAPEVHLCLIT